jgi:hypothetical protein
MKIHILFDGNSGDESGIAIAAFRTKKALRAYVREEYPWARGEQRDAPSELYWQWHDGSGRGGGWIAGREVDLVA